MMNAVSRIYIVYTSIYYAYTFYGVYSALATGAAVSTYVANTVRTPVMSGAKSLRRVRRRVWNWLITDQQSNTINY